jgi:hypothetical protein
VRRTLPGAQGGRDAALALPIEVERLLERAERFALGHPLARLERRASQWYFDRITAPPAGSPRERARRIREREWALVDRVTHAWGRPVIEVMADDPSFAEAPPIERALVPALLASERAVFTVVAVRDVVAVLVVPRDGRRFLVHARPVDIQLAPRMLLIGRLIPLGDGPWLCSPGMEVLSPRGLKLYSRKTVAAAFFEPPDDLDVAVGLEIAVDQYWRKRYERRLPDPAESTDEALALGREIEAALVEAGRARPAEPGPQPEGRPEPPPGVDGLELEIPELEDDTFCHDYDVDEVMDEWIEVVHMQSAIGIAQRIRAQVEEASTRQARANLHLPYFELLADTQEGSQLWAEVSSGLLVLRALDDAMRSGDGPRVMYDDKVRASIATIDPASPVRPVLARAFELIAAVGRPDMRRVGPELRAYADVLESQHRADLAHEVHESVARYEHDRDAIRGR